MLTKKITIENLEQALGVKLFVARGNVGNMTDFTLQPGVYHVGEFSSGRPSDSVSIYGLLLVIHAASNSQITQIFNNGSNQLFIRHRHFNEPSFTAWSKIN